VDDVVGEVRPDTRVDAAAETKAIVEGSLDGAVEELPPPYVVSLALQRGPYPYEHRTVVLAALDAVTASESYPDDWVKAIRRGHKEGGDVRILRIALRRDEVTSLFEQRTAHYRPDLDAPQARDRYVIRVALCLDEPPVVVAAVDEEMALGMGIEVAGPLRSMPVFYRRQAAKAYGELREVLISLPRSAVDEVFDPPPIEAQVVGLLKGDDPRF
jgi:hypothetical protein